MAKFTLLFSLLFSTLALASSGAGNGGDALVCQDSPDYGDQTILLDTHEAYKRRLTLDLGDAQSHRAMVAVAVGRLMKKDVVTAQKLYQYAMEMVNDIELLEQFPESRGQVLYIGNDVVGEINDSLHVTIPIGCEIRQLVSQKEPKYRFDYRYEINKQLWDQLNVFNQSMTILHEAWYRIMIENDQDDEHDSYGARYMNGIVASKEFEDFTFADYIRDIAETELKTYTTFNTSGALVGKQVELDLTSSLTIEDGLICVKDAPIKAQLKRFGLRGIFQGITTLDVKFEKACFKNSKISKLTLPNDVAEKGFLLSMDLYQIKAEKAGAPSVEMIFHPSGKLKTLTNIKTDFIVGFYYDCDGSKIFERKEGCSGPYRHYPSQVNSPSQVFFSSIDESPSNVEVPLNI